MTLTISTAQTGILYACVVVQDSQYLLYIFYDRKYFMFPGFLWRFHVLHARPEGGVGEAGGWVCITDVRQSDCAADVIQL